MTSYNSLNFLISSEIIYVCSGSSNSTRPTKTWYLFMDYSQPWSRPTRQRFAAHQWAAAHRLRTAVLESGEGFFGVVPTLCKTADQKQKDRRKQYSGRRRQMQADSDSQPCRRDPVSGQ